MKKNQIKIVNLKNLSKGFIFLFLMVTILGFVLKKESSNCDFSTFSQIRKVQQTKSIDKEDVILALGYSFERDTTMDGSVLRFYGKCNNGFDSNERLRWNKTSNSVMYTTYSSESYIAMKNQIKLINGCERVERGGWDVYSYCSDMHAYLAYADEVYEIGFYIIEFQGKGKKK